MNFNIGKAGRHFSGQIGAFSKKKKKKKRRNYGANPLPKFKEVTEITFVSSVGSFYTINNASRCPHAICQISVDFIGWLMVYAQKKVAEIVRRVTLSV